MAPAKRHVSKLSTLSCASFDREVQRCKRLHWYSLQAELEQECNKDNTRFWKSIGKIGVSSAKRNLIPFEITNQDGTVSHNTQDVLNKWKFDFSNLLNCNSNNDIEIPAEDRPVPERHKPLFEENFTILEVKKAVQSAKRGKSCGFDEIPRVVVVLSVSSALPSFFKNRKFSVPPLEKKKLTPFKNKKKVKKKI